MSHYIEIQYTMKSLYQFLFMVGLALTVAGVVLWVKAGLPLRIDEISTIIFGTRPWNLGKDSYFFLIILGVFVAMYSAIELNLKRWQDNR